MRAWWLWKWHLFWIWRVRQAERLAMAVAWALPKYLVYWCAIRLMAHATTGRYGSTVVPDLTVMDALKRWETAS